MRNSSKQQDVEDVRQVRTYVCKKLHGIFIFSSIRAYKVEAELLLPDLSYKQYNLFQKTSKRNTLYIFIYLTSDQ